MKFIPIKEALQITGHPSPGAFDRWVRRWNIIHPERLVLRRIGCVEEGSLEAALALEIEERTPGYRAAQALGELAKEDSN